MAAKDSAVRQRAEVASARRAPAEAPRKERARLGVVDRRQLLVRARRRQARALITLSGCILAGALALAAAGHAIVASYQLRADSLQSQVSSALAQQQNLQWERSQLERPSRVLSIAESRLKMVSPSGVTYLPPVNPGESVAAAHSPKSSTPTGSPSSRHRSR